MKKVQSREEVTKWISKFFDTVRTTEEFNGNEGGIWVCGECDNTYGGLTIYNYYTTSKMYDLGVLRKFEEMLQKKGWFSSWYDPGTVMIWKI